MRVLVCGGRDFDDVELVYAVLDGIHYKTPIRCIIEGGSRGADYLSCRWSASRKLDEHVRFSADWTLYGKSAGPIRNKRMIDEGRPDIVVAFPGGGGTKNMVEQAEKAGLQVVKIQPRGNP